MSVTCNCCQRTFAGEPEYFEHFVESRAEDKQLKLLDWRLGIHIEAAAKIIGASIYALSKSLDAQNVRWDRIASSLERSVGFQEQELELRRDSHEIMETAQRLIATMHGDPPPTPPAPKPPEWIGDALKGD